jgi:hypothetical protein
VGETIVYTQFDSFLATYSSRNFMTDRLKRVVLTLVSGSALAIAPLAYATVAVPAPSHADTDPKCDESLPLQGNNDNNAPCGDQTQAQGQPQGQGLDCPDGTIVDTKNHQCVDLTAGIGRQLAALPPPPSLSGFGGGGGVGGLGKIPSLGTINMPDLVLPSLGLGLVPNLQVNLQPKFPSFNPLGLG